MKITPNLLLKFVFNDCLTFQQKKIRELEMAKANNGENKTTCLLKRKSDSESTTDNESSSSNSSKKWKSSSGSLSMEQASKLIATRDQSKLRDKELKNLIIQLTQGQVRNPKFFFDCFKQKIGEKSII